MHKLNYKGVTLYAANNDGVAVVSLANGMEVTRFLVCVDFDAEIREWIKAAKLDNALDAFCDKYDLWPVSEYRFA